MNVSVIGLGQMGVKIAQLYVEKGYQVTVWNRTPSRANGIKGVIIAGSVQEAINKSDFIVICVFDNKAVSEVLEAIGDRTVFKNKTIINLTTGNPAEATKLEIFVNRYNGTYLNGALQVAPDQMGLPGTTILLSGNSKSYNNSQEILSVLGGNLKFIDEKAGASSAMDLATLTWLYGSYVGMIYGAALARANGLKPEAYGNILSEISPDFIRFFQHELSVIQRGDFSITQSPLAISVTATKRIADAIGETGARNEFPELIAGLLKDADEMGFGGE